MSIQSLRTDDCAEEVISTYANMVYRLAFAQVKNKHDADDIFQEVFLRYIRKKRIFASEEHRKAWFLRVTINCGKKFCYSAWQQKTSPLIGDVIANSENSFTFSLPEENELYTLLLTLSPKYRTVLHLFYYEDFSVEQIAQLLHRRASTIRTQLSRGRAILKQKKEGEENA